MDPTEALRRPPRVAEPRPLPTPPTGAEPSGAWARVLPFAAFIALIAVAPWIDESTQALSLWDSRWNYALRSGLAALLMASFITRYEELWRAPPARFGAWAVALVTGVAVFVLWILLDQPWATLGSSAGYNPLDAAGGLRWDLVLLRLGGAVLVVPPMEELFWRSFVMRFIQAPAFRGVAPGAVGLRALIISAVLFALEHNLWLGGLLAGLAYGELYRRYGNLWLPIAAHGVTNALLGVWVVAYGQWHLW